MKTLKKLLTILETDLAVMMLVIIAVVTVVSCMDDIIYGLVRLIARL